MYLLSLVSYFVMNWQRIIANPYRLAKCYLWISIQLYLHSKIKNSDENLEVYVDRV